MSGPLHTSFHMLQSIYIIFKCFLKSIQECIGWKKVRYNKVSENYRTCVSMLDIAYEEVFRLLFYNFITSRITNTDLAILKNNVNCAEEILAIALSQKFMSYLKECMNNSSDKRWRLFCCFFNVANIFKHHQHCMKSGDTVLMEKIENNFCGTLYFYY